MIYLDAVNHLLAVHETTPIIDYKGFTRGELKVGWLVGRLAGWLAGWLGIRSVRSAPLPSLPTRSSTNQLQVEKLRKKARTRKREREWQMSFHSFIRSFLND